MTLVSQHFQADHARLDNLLQQFLDTLSTDFNQAKQYFNAFKQGLEQHIDWEEKVLFPHFIEYTALIHGPIHVMNREHLEIKQKLQDISEQLDNHSDEEVLDEALHIHRLERLLLDHNIKEENILYPKLDSLLNQAEAQQILETISVTSMEKT